MKHLIIAAAALWILFQVGEMFWSSKDQLSSEGLSKLLEAPHHSIENPYHNGYFYLFGLTAPALFDPARAGYEIWVEESEEAERAGSDNNGSSRTDLGLTVSPELASMIWDADEPLNEIRKTDKALRSEIAQQQVLLTRYAHWLDLPFDDWGFGRRVTPRYQDIMSAHRLFVVEGFGLGTSQGLERLRKDLQFWRLVLRASKTIGTKMLAQVIITDDLHFLSRILAKPTVDPSILTTGLQLTLPLSPSEYSLRWPIRHQLALAVKRNRASHISKNSLIERVKVQDEWLLRESALPPHAFDGIEHPPSRSVFGVALQSAQAWSTYAAYYDALITASENKAKNFPRMRDVIGTFQRGLVERLVNPHPIEPEWEMFHRKLMETDTRLRLASLQIQLRRPSAHTTVPTRLAEVGSHYFDPFTGLPMLWSPTQHKLYSVGKDRLDDGGDPTFDISVPAVVATAQSATKESAQGRSNHRSTR